MSARRIPHGLVIVVALVALVSSACDWSQWGASAVHTGALSFEGGVSPDTVPTFVASTVTHPAPTGQVAVSGQYVFVQRDGTLTALDARSYGVGWVANLPAGSTLGSVPAIDPTSGTVFVVVAGPANPQLVGFDINGMRNCNAVMYTCRPVFAAQLGTTSGPASPPVVDHGKVFANGASALYAFDANGQTNCTSSLNTQNCTPLWSARVAGAQRGLGPAVANGVVYDAVKAGSGTGIGAFNTANGQSLWSASPAKETMTASPSVSSTSVFVPTAGGIEAFPASGCGAATCAPSFTLQPKTGDRSGSMLATAALDGSKVFATDTNGSLYAWPQSGCGAPTCQPTASNVIDAPSTPASDFAQMPAIVNGILFVTAQRVVSGADHVFAVALDASLAEVASWDLGVGSVGPALASVSEAAGAVYAPTDSALVALRAPAVQPLASLTTDTLPLTPGFAPSTFDYVLRCASGSNTVTFTMTATPGGTVQLVAPITTSPSDSQTQTVALNENQAAVVRAADAHGASADYWIRCLPHDFPSLSATRPGAGGPSPGWYVLGNSFVTPNVGSYAMILDTNGTPVWYRHATPGGATNVTPIAHDTVAFIQDLQFGGFTTDPNSQYDVYNLDNNTTSALRAVGVPSDQHELVTAPNGDHLFLSYPLKSGVDLTGLSGSPTPGPNSTIADCVVQDVDPQGNLVWQWAASDHFDPRTETTLSPVPSSTINGQTVYDVFHCNSADPNPNGNVLVSARHMNAVFEIRRSDGKVLWKMGGTPTNKDGAAIIQVQNDPNGSFVMQHDARYAPNGDITLFDNETPMAHPARGVEYAVDFTTNTAHPVFAFPAPMNRSSCCTGDFRLGPDGDRVVGWGFLIYGGGPLFTELDPSGSDVFDVSIPDGGASYRVVKAPPTRFDINVLRSTAGQ